MSQKFCHSFGYLSISDFLKQILPRNTLIILFFFYTHQSLSTKTKHFGAGCSSPGSWLKINGSVLRDQKVWKKTKELNMCRIYICFQKSLIDKFLRTLKKKISYLTYLLQRIKCERIFFLPKKNWNIREFRSYSFRTVFWLG